MNIYVVKGVGVGKTALSSFDAALKDVGVYNYNLIQLSSIIPPDSHVSKAKQYKTPEEEYGYKLYVVKAEMRSQETGKYIAAGIGWYQFGDGRGLFVEHELIGETKVAIESEMEFRITNSLKDLCQFRNIKFEVSKFNSSISVAKVEDHPTCVLALSIYQSEGWRE